ncbi:MAG: hypothetical protein ACE5GB_09775, partial [Acidimicrobiales bacterium]
MSRRRLVALLVGLAVTAAACGGGAQDAPDDAGEEPSSGPVPESPEELLTEPPTSTLAPGTELFSPTETDRPLDLSGGVA